MLKQQQTMKINQFFLAFMKLRYKCSWEIIDLEITSICAILGSLLL